MIEDLGEMHTPNPDEPGEFADSLGERVLVLRHDNIVVSHTILSRGNAIENEWSLAQIGDMNQWPQRENGQGVGSLAVVTPVKNNSCKPGALHPTLARQV